MVHPIFKQTCLGLFENSEEQQEISGISNLSRQETPNSVEGQRDTALEVS